MVILLCVCNYIFGLKGRQATQANEPVHADQVEHRHLCAMSDSATQGLHERLPLDESQ